MLDLSPGQHPTAGPEGLVHEMIGLTELVILRRIRIHGGFEF